MRLLFFCLFFSVFLSSRLLRQLVLKKTDAASLGDTSTLLDPHVVDVLKHSVADLLAAAEKAKK